MSTTTANPMDLTIDTAVAGVTLADDIALGRVAGGALAKQFAKFAAKRAAVAGVAVSVPVAGWVVGVGLTVADVAINYDEYASLGKTLWGAGSDTVKGWFGNDQQGIAAETGVLDTTTGKVSVAAATGIGSWQVWNMFRDGDAAPEASAKAAPIKYDNGIDFDSDSDSSSGGDGSPDPEGGKKPGVLSRLAKSKFGRLGGAAMAVAGVISWGSEIYNSVWGEDEPTSHLENAEFREFDYRNHLASVLDMDPLNNTDQVILNNIDNMLKDPAKWVDNPDLVASLSQDLSPEQWQNLYVQEFKPDVERIIRESNRQLGEDTFSINDQNALATKTFELMTYRLGM